MGPLALLQGERHDLPFQRSWRALAVVMFLALAMTVPAVSVFGQALEGWRELEGLVDLVGALFSSFWLLGWSVGLLLIWAIAVVMLFGREVVLIRPREMEVILGVPGVGVGAIYALGRVRNLRRESPEKGSGHAWRGAHAVFDYRTDEAHFGSRLSTESVAHLAERLERAFGGKLPTGEPSAGDRDPQAPPSPPSSAPDHETERAAPRSPPTLISPSTLALIGANLAPVIGALLFGWSLGDVMLLYWAESGVIGLYNIAKMFVIGRWLALFACLFFLGHYGGFMAGHLLFLWALFVQGSESLSGDSLSDVGRVFVSMWPALVALFLSHGVSFSVNFLGRREYAGRNLSQQMGEPYKRILIMHVTIIFGGILTMALGNALPVLLLLIGLKMAADVRGHLKERSSPV